MAKIGSFNIIFNPVIFRGFLFHKPVTGQELFFAVSNSKPGLADFDIKFWHLDKITDLF